MHNRLFAWKGLRKGRPLKVCLFYFTHCANWHNYQFNSWENMGDDWGGDGFLLPKPPKWTSGKRLCLIARGGCVAQEYAEKFYNSRRWQETRAAYARSVSYLCEECLKQGIYKTGEIVHHKTHITADNIDNPDVTLSWDNLMYVCRDCHARFHKAHNKRYGFDESGNVIPPL